MPFLGLCVASVLPLISQQTRSEKLWAEILIRYNDVENPSAGKRIDSRRDSCSYSQVIETQYNESEGMPLHEKPRE